MAGFKYQPGGLSRLHQRGGLSGCAGIGRDAYFVSNRCRRRSCARRVLFRKRAFSIQATLIASQKAPVPYLASASAQMPRPAEAAERMIPPMRNWRGVMLGMVLLIRGAREPMDLWGHPGVSKEATSGVFGEGSSPKRELIHRCRVARQPADDPVHLIAMPWSQGDPWSSYPLKRLEEEIMDPTAQLDAAGWPTLASHAPRLPLWPRTRQQGPQVPSRPA